MRQARTLVIAALILAVTSGAFAFSFKVPYTGPVKWKFTNWEEGRAYAPTVDNFGPGTDFVNPGDYVTLTGAALASAKANQNPLTGGGGFFTTLPAAQRDNEDVWGVFQVREILGTTTPQFPGNNAGYTIDLYDVDDPTDDMWGLFYGIEDIQVRMTYDNVGDDGIAYTLDDEFELTIQSTGMHDPDGDGNGDIFFDLYETPHGQTVGAPGARGATIDTYDTWADGNTANMYLRGTTVEGKFAENPLSSLRTRSLVSAAATPLNSFSDAGSADLFLEWDVTVGAGSQWSGPSHPFYEDVDLLLSTDTWAGGPVGSDWLMQSDDPAIGYFVPEPLTMLGVGLAVAGLGGYVRKRRS